MKYSQCPAAVQPCIGRNALFSSNHQTSSSPSSSNISSPVSSQSSQVAAFHNRTPLIPPSLLDYFPHVGGDGLRVTWSHGINSRSKLASSLMGHEYVIEGDVTLAETTRYPIPIMAHPPLNMSDITLEDWLIEIIRSDACKGIKLDFKTTRVVEPAFRVLARHADYLKGPIILNADILPGANKPSTPPVDAWTFLMLCRTRFPKSIISIGWTTEVDDVSLKLGYTREMVDQMASLVKEYSLMQPVTFPINAALLKLSISEFQRLLYQVPNSSLTVWSHRSDPVDVNDLIILRKTFGYNQIFYDLPEDILNSFRAEIFGR